MVRFCNTPCIQAKRLQRRIKSDNSTFYDTLLSNVYLLQSIGQIFIFGDFNSRIGNLDDHISGIHVIPDRDIIDFDINAYVKPSDPVIQTLPVSVGGTVEVSCTTTGCRPAANISWLYQGSTATGQTALTLTCTTGSSNPASDIRWKNGSVTLSSNRPYMETTGNSNGLVRSQQLILHPTRYMDGDGISCEVSNAESQSDVVDTITLSLKYSPLVTIQEQQQNTLREGESKQLPCEVNSKPSATIKWYHGNSLIIQGTPVSNVLNYSLTPVKRTHYGTYICRADNGIGSENQEKISITVRFKPLTTTITGNSNVIANGKNTLPLVCTSGSSNPISDITWRINSVITPSNGSLSDQSGEYGGMKRRRRLTLTPTRDNDGDRISCEANNSIGTSGKKTVELNLRLKFVEKKEKAFLDV
ncbi:nephrin-like [Mercenaria mercenaria]|uniref:nephrin-like n=1 Tax=Mercenaria mercenaria TaxID=6596 RepID=UPI00234F6E9E|nr:nephrin-like [Mercenaria mercenaria]